MNELNVSLQHSILTLAAQGWSNRRIARELGLHRETVGRHLRLAGSKPAKPENARNRMKSAQWRARPAPLVSTTSRMRLNSLLSGKFSSFGLTPSLFTFRAGLSSWPRPACSKIILSVLRVLLKTDTL